VAREQTVRILAEMVANVIAIEVELGEAVAAGDAVCLLESMKMEIPVLAENPGVVTAIKVTPGDVVQEGDILVELTAPR
jgi:acetyl-CoA carboxylase biotin carboxyl carrier protein